MAGRGGLLSGKRHLIAALPIFQEPVSNRRLAIVFIAVAVITVGGLPGRARGRRSGLFGLRGAAPKMTSSKQGLRSVSTPPTRINKVRFFRTCPNMCSRGGKNPR